MPQDKDRSKEEWLKQGYDNLDKLSGDDKNFVALWKAVGEAEGFLENKDKIAGISLRLEIQEAMPDALASLGKVKKIENIHKKDA